MVEYIIEQVEDGEVIALVHTERDGRRSFIKPSYDGYAHVSKYRVRDRAEKAAKGLENVRIVPTYGGIVYGTKASVVPVQPKINKRSAYRSI